MKKHDHIDEVVEPLDALLRSVSEQWRRQLSALRSAIDDQIGAIDSTLEQISRAAAETTQRERQQNEAIAATNSILRGALDDAKQQLEAAKDGAASALAARTVADARYREASRDIQQLTAALDEAHARLADANRQRTSAVGAAPPVQRRPDPPVQKKPEPSVQKPPTQDWSDVLAQMQRERDHLRAIVVGIPIPADPPSVASGPAGTPKKPLQFSEPARDAKRVKIRRGVEVSVDGIAGELVDLSLGGAQALLTQGVKPNQLVRLTIAAPDTEIVCKGRIVWAVFEQPPTSVSVFRCGVKFTDVDGVAVERFMNDFCEKPTLGQLRNSSSGTARSG